MFRWAVSEELVPRELYEGLRSVKGLRCGGRDDVAESKPVTPVSNEHRLAAKPHMVRQVWDMCEIQRLTGARPGEMVRLRTKDIEQSGDVWTYDPERHKNTHRRLPRTIFFGPKAQEILTPYLLNRQPDQAIFSAREAEAEWREKKRANRNSKVQPSQVKRAEVSALRIRKRSPGDHYTVTTYRRAIARACEKAQIPAWTPHRLRHTAGTDIRRQYDVDAASAVLGHRSVQSTQVYSANQSEKAQRIIAAVG